MFRTPEGEPFWGGTYFPPDQRYGRPGFPQVLDTIAEVYANDRERVVKNTVALKEALGKLSENLPGGAIPIEALDQVALRLLQEVDRSEEHTSELQSLMRISYAVFCWKKKKKKTMHKQQRN